MKRNFIILWFLAVIGGMGAVWGNGLRERLEGEKTLGGTTVIQETLGEGPKAEKGGAETHPTEKHPPLTRGGLQDQATKKVVVIEVEDMVDEGLYESIKRRTEAALAGGADYIIYQMDTFGGRLDSGINIYDYFLKEVKPRARTVAFVPTKAISAGALISVACQDIIMEDVSKIGDCAPITMGGTLEGVEREKIETTLRSYFADAAQANTYPSAILRAMVTDKLKVYQVKNLATGQYEYFTEEELPREKAGGENQKSEDRSQKSEEEEEEAQPGAAVPHTKYDLDNKRLIDGGETLVTLTAREATEYGVSRKVVADLEGALRFLEERDGVVFERPAVVMETTWSEELVRWLASPAVTGVLVLVIMACFYFEMKSGGLGLAAIVGVAALALLLGSKFLIGMANWWEIAAIVLGLGLLAVEIFLVPGFGVTGIAGIILIIIGSSAILTNYPPVFFIAHMKWFVIAVFSFIILVIIFGKLFHYLPGTKHFDKLILPPPEENKLYSISESSLTDDTQVHLGLRGRTMSILKPSGIAKFGKRRLEVVSRGEMIEADQEIIVVAVEGNRIIVKTI